MSAHGLSKEEQFHRAFSMLSKEGQKSFVELVSSKASSISPFVPYEVVSFGDNLSISLEIGEEKGVMTFYMPSPKEYVESLEFLQRLALDAQGCGCYALPNIDTGRAFECMYKAYVQKRGDIRKEDDE